MKDTNKTDTKRGDVAKFKKISIILAVLFAMLILSLALYYIFENFIHSSVHVALWAITMYFGIRFEKERKRLNIKTYKEVIALCKGKSLEDIEKDRE